VASNELSTHFQENLREKLPHFLERLTANLEKSSELSQEEKSMLRIYLGEVHVGLDLIAPYLKPDMRVLEVGSGIGALGYFLSQNHVNVLGIEPHGTGFDAMDKLSTYVRATLKGNPEFVCKRKGCEELNLKEDGEFDLIFSVHVLEHLAELENSLIAMRQVMSPTGSMVHLCPNYRFPYDPHFSLPIVFWSSRLTRVLFRKRISKDVPLWDSLNFVGWGELQKIVRKHDMEFDLKKGVMADFFKRLLSDPIFRDRHAGLAAKLAGFVARTPLIHILKLWPAGCASPMIIRLKNTQQPLK